MVSDVRVTQEVERSYRQTGRLRVPSFHLGVIIITLFKDTAHVLCPEPSVLLILVYLFGPCNKPEAM